MKEEEQEISVKLSAENIKCKNCIFATDNPFDYHCAKFKLKPNEVLFDGKECPKFKVGEGEE